MEATEQATKRRKKASGLTDTAAKNAKPEAKPYRLRDTDGLFLQVQPRGTKLWRYRFWLHDKEGMAALGAYPDISLADARERRNEARKLVANGINPVHAAQQAKIEAVQEQQRNTLGTFGVVCAAWREVTDKALRPLTIRQREREIAKYLLPELRERHIGGITRMELAERLKAVAKHAPEVARNLRTYLDGLFEHAIDNGILSANPTPPRKIFSARQQKNNAAIGGDRIGQFLLELESAPVTERVRSATLLKILSVGRKSEACGARWQEFDLDAALWKIPGERMKAGREHLVPLPHQAVAMLRKLHSKRLDAPAEFDFVYPNRRDPRRPMAGNSLNALLSRMGFGGDATPHGWRAAFSTHFNGLGANPDVIERCLAHVPKDQVRAVYNRHQYVDERRVMLQEWADFLDSEREAERSKIPT